MNRPAPHVPPPAQPLSRLPREFLAVFSYGRKALILVWETSRTLSLWMAGLTVLAGALPALVAKLCLATLRGQWKALPEVSDREAREITLRFPRRSKGAVAVIDGELVKLAEIVDLKIHPSALQVVMPKANEAAAAGPAEIVLTPA